MDQGTTTLETDLPGWTEPLRQPSNDPLRPEVTETLREGRPPRTLEHDQADESAVAAPGPAEDVPLPPTSTLRAAGRSPASTDPKAFLAATSALVGIASMGVHYARGAPETGAWMADEEDVANIAEPLSRIMARHSPVTGSEANDVGDAIAAAVGIANYGLKNIAREHAARSAPLEQQASQPSGG